MATWSVSGAVSLGAVTTSGACIYADLIETTVDGGGTGDYLTLNAAETANFGASGANLVTGEEKVVCSCICTNGAADTTAVTISGQTTDASHTITITVPEAYRHDGSGAVPTGNVYRREATNSSGILTLTDNVSFTGVVVVVIVTNTTTYNGLSNQNTNITLDSCVAIGTASSTGAIFGITIQSSGAVIAVYAKNCLSRVTCNAGRAFLVTGANATAHLSCCTAIKSVGTDTHGLRLVSGTGILKNCLSFGNTTDYSGNFSALSTKNGYSNGTGPSGGSNSINLGTDSAIFRNYAENDFHLESNNGPASYVGADLDQDATLPVTTDIDGDARHATTPCIGADEWHALTWTATGAITLPSATVAGTPSTIVCIVDPDNAAGTHYTSLNAAEAAAFNATGLDLVTNDEHVYVLCRATSGTDDEVACAVNGFITSATNRVEIRGDSTGFSYPTGNKYRLAPANVTALIIQDDNVVVRNLPIKTSGTATGSTNCVYIENVTGCIVRDCFITSTLDEAVHVSRGVYANLTTAGKVAYVYNNIADGFSGSAGTEAAIRLYGSGTMYAYNNVTVKSTIGIQRANGLLYAKNNLSFGNTSDYDGIFRSGTTNNGYSTGAPNGDAAPVDLGVDDAVIFTDYDGGEYRLFASRANPAHVAGTDLRADAAIAVLEDIEGQTRYEHPCLGADELQALGAITLPTIEVSNVSEIEWWATGAITLPTVVVSGASQIEWYATGALTLASATVAGTAAVERREVTGSITLPAVEVSGASHSGLLATGAISLQAATVEGSVKVGWGATGALTLAPVTVAGASTVSWGVSGAIVLPAAQVSGHAQTEWVATGAVALPAATVDGSAATLWPATGAIALGAVTVAGTAKVGWYATGSIALGAVTVAGTALEKITASGAPTLPAAQVAGTVTVPARQATGAVTLPSVTVAGTSAVSWYTTGAITLPAATVAGTAGTVHMDAAGAITLPAVTVSGTVWRIHIAIGHITLPSIVVRSPLARVGKVRRGAFRMITPVRLRARFASARNGSRSRARSAR